MQDSRHSKSGQAIIFLMVVLVIGILAVVWSYDLHRVVNAKLRMRNAGDAAALAAARWQGHTLNMIGDLNLIQAALITEAMQDPSGAGGTDPMLHELRSRLEVLGPLAAFAVAQQAAFNNGAIPDPALSSNLLEMAESFRDDPSWHRFDGAYEDYADLLEDIAVRGAAVSAYQVTFRPRNHPLVQEEFYWAVAQGMQGMWCPMKNYDYHLEHYENFESWPDLNDEFSYGFILDLKLDEFYSIDASGYAIPPDSSVYGDAADLAEDATDYFVEYPFAMDIVGRAFFGDSEALWHVYDSTWDDPWPRAAEYEDVTGLRRGQWKPLALRGNVKDEYNYLGAVAGVAMAADVHRGILASSDNESIGMEYKAKAEGLWFSGYTGLLISVRRVFGAALSIRVCISLLSGCSPGAF